MLSVRPGAFRLFLALLVFVHHASRVSVGSAAVYVFFVLSGYWMHRMWVDRYAALRRPYLSYLVSRAWRLLPVFLLVGLINWVVLASLGQSAEAIGGDPWWVAAGASVVILGYAALPVQPLGPAWSLDIEARYYLIAPIISTLVASRRWMMALLAGAGAASLAAAIIWPPRTSLLAYLVFFVAGVAAARLDWRPRVRAAVASTGAIVSLLIVVVMVVPGALFGGSAPGPMFVWNPVLNVAIGVLAIPVAVYSTGQHGGSDDRMKADLSYIVYLLHWPAIAWLTWLDRPVLARLPYMVGAWIIVLVGSWVIWRWVDRPLNAARARWVSGRARESAALIAQEPSAP